MRLYLHHLPGLSIVRNNVADPFHAAEGRAILRREVAESGIELCEHAEDADLCGLPAHWLNYRGELARQALRFFDERRRAGQRVMVWVNGDDEVDFPFPNLLVFQAAVRNSRRRRFEVRTYPPFVDDIVASVFDGSVPRWPNVEMPVVGFCGQAQPVLVQETKRLVHKALARVLSRLGNRNAVPEPWNSHVRLRNRVLRTLQNDSRITANFIIRDHYRAGLRNKADRRNLKHPTALEFFQNIVASDYTVCVRGGGNFSMRLYETLCLGRLPLIIDTDLLLPWPTAPEWGQVALTVDVNDLRELGDRVIDHWRSLRQRPEDAFLAARRFWTERFSLPGFFSHFRELLIL